MAELVFDLARKITEKLASIAYDEVCLAWDVKTDLQKLEHTMSTIKGVLLDAEEKHAHNQEVCSWLQQLKDVFYDADDVLDEFDCEALRRQVMETYHYEVCRFFSPSNPIAFRLRVGHKIKEIRERLDELQANKAIFDTLTDLQGDHDKKHLMIMRENNMTHSFICASKVIGRDYDKEVIVDLLMQQKENIVTEEKKSENVSVIPVVGIGGVGKTTLAKLVYNDEKVIRHFNLRMWVHVSVDFNITRLTKEILNSASEKITRDHDELSMDKLQEKLRRALEDKKFFLVLDDVWNEDRINWSDLRDLLEGAKSGSKILVTTRNFSVASIMGTISPYNLQGLSTDNCLSLFVKCAFEEGKEKQHPNLFEIGKDIVRKCGGVPLAVRTLGSQLYSKTDELEWVLIRDSEIWELEREGNGRILPALRLSYSQLPSHLKQCLAYCSLLPKDRSRYNSIELIDCWMAHGILQSDHHENMELEDVGELYFKELSARSFFEHVEVAEGDYGLFHRFSMHDLIHNLVQSVAHGECSIVNSRTKHISENVRHLLIMKFDGQNDSAMLQKLNKVRTITVEHIPIDESFLDTFFLRFKYLRVLSLVALSLEVLPSSIGTLKHLRYLDLTSNGRITKLPNAICKLQSLQTLSLEACRNLEELPRDMSNLISLRWLLLTTKQTCFPKNGVGCIKSLRFLCIENCCNLNSLPPDMGYFAALRTLVIRNCEQLDLVNGNYQVISLRLRKLVIRNLPRMMKLPEWLQGAANTLQDLYIVNCANLAELPGWLTSLKSIRSLVLKSCQKLRSLPEEMHQLTALRELKIEDCPELERRCQRDIGEDWPKIAHVPNVSLSISN